MTKILLLVLLLGSALAFAELKPEPVGIIRTLPAPYPDHWVIAHDLAFFHMNDGKLIVLDPLAPTQPQQYMGMVNSTFVGHFAMSTKRRELYVAETFYSRGQRGERTDVLTIYDQSTLAPVAEVILPGAKRASTVPERYGFQLIDDDRLALLFNLTPATSVTVVDLERRAVLNEVPIAGCVLIYPTGKRGFTSLCADGAMLSYQLNADGTVASEIRSAPVWDIDADPLFEKPVIQAGIGYFPSFGGMLLPVDLSGNAAKPGKAWSLLSDEERASGWRPGGWQFLDVGAAGELYMLFHPESYNGSHKDGGPEVWVFDLKTQQRERRIELQNWAVSLVLTGGDKPLLVTTNSEMNLDVYDAASGEYLRTLSDFGHETPFVVHRAN